jgi:fatty acid desaturase
MSNVQQRIRRPVSPAALQIPWIANFVLAGVHIFVNVFQLFVLPLYFLPKSMRWSLILVSIAALNNPFWALIHEAIHDLFSASSRTNVAAGRLLSVFFGSPFHVLRLTHLSHHKFNRSPLEKGTEIYDPTRVSKLRASFQYFFYIFCGLYLLEVSSAFLFFLPAWSFHRLGRRLADQGNAQEKWLAIKFMDAKLVREIRMDGIAILLVFGLSAFCYGAHWIALISLLTTRMFLVSFMDNVYHYGSTLNITISGHNLRLPRILSILILNFNFHRIHHRNTAVPWQKLPELFVAYSERFDRGLLTAALNQLRGPIPLSELMDPRPATTKVKFVPQQRESIANDQW